MYTPVAGLVFLAGALAGGSRLARGTTMPDNNILWNGYGLKITKQYIMERLWIKDHETIYYGTVMD